MAFSDAFGGALARDAGEDVGHYAITQGSLALSTDYSLTFVGANLSITARPIEVTADPQTKVYGNADPSLTYKITAGSLAFSDAFGGALTRDAGENVGDYAITQGSLNLSANYVLTYVGANLSITARPVEVTAEAAQSKTYGDADPEFAYTITGGSLAFSDTFSGHLTRTAGEDVGQYDILIGSLTLGTNYDLTYKSAKFTIDTRPITVAADPKTKIYGNTDPSLTYQVTVGNLVGTDGFTGTPLRDSGEDVGSYAIHQGSLTAGGNYALTFVGANLEITKRAVTITADAAGKTYGDDDPALTYQITHGSLAFSDHFAGSLTRDAGENIGSYPIRQGTVALSTNYDLTYVGENLVIGQRAITVTADPKTKVYGEADPGLTYQITAGSLKSGDSITGDLARAAGNNVGSYAITRGTLTAGGNYALTYVGANLAITKRPITVTADDKTKTYGDSDPALTQSITSGTLAYGDLLSGSLMRDVGEHVNSYSINQGTLTAGGNYTLSFVPGHLAITQRPVTVTAADKTKVYGNADPTFTYSISNGSLVGSDGFTGALTRETGQHVGSYEIRQGTLGLSADYNLTFVPGHLAVTQRCVTVAADPQTKIYGDTDPSLTYHITAGSLAYSDAFAGVLSRAAGENVGSYAIGQNTLTLGTDYALTVTGSTLTITKRSVTVTADNKSKPWGASDPALTYSITTGSLAFSDAVGGSLVRDPGEDGGTYAIRQGTLALSGNYAMTFNNGTFTITPSLILKGFYQPVTMSGSSLVWNTAKGGSTVPLKFNVFTSQGTELTSTSVVKSLTYQVVTSLGLTGTVDPLDTLATGGTVLRYDGTAGQFVYNWQTPKGANYYRLTVGFVDGSSLVAYFQMK